jgi:hypothetical protein
MLKGLITVKPYPKLFADSFQYHLKFSINPEESKSLERKLSRNGKWRNTRYMILLILIPLAGFLFIAQGSSLEKVIGIFTGGLAIFTGLMRVLDSNAARNTST